MADRVDWFTGQLVAQQEMDLADENLEVAIRRITSDAGLTGISEGIGVTEHAGSPNTTVDTSVGTATGPNGERMRVGVAGNVNCAVDRNNVSTNVATPGNTRILSLILTPDRTLSDPRTDAMSQTVYFLRSESYKFEIVQGAEAAVPTPPSIPVGSICVADITRFNGVTAILNAHITTSGAGARRQDVYVFEGAAWRIRRGKPKDAFNDLFQRYDNHVNGNIDQHEAGDLSWGGSDFWADGTTTVGAGTLDSAVKEVVSDLASTATLDSGGQRVGIDSDSSVSPTLSAGTIRQRLRDQRLAANLAYAGSPAWADATTIPAGTIEASIDAIPTALAASGGAAKVSMAAVGNFTGGTIQAAIAQLAATTASNDGAKRIGREAVGNFTGATVAAQFLELTATTAANDGAKRIGAQANGNLLAGTVRTQLDELDAEKGGLGLANTWTSTNLFSGQVTFGGGLWPALSARAVEREHDLNVMTETHASVAAVEKSDLTVTVLGDSVAIPDILTSVQASSGRAFTMQLKRPLHGNTMTAVKIETRYVGPASDASMTKANYTVLRWRATTSGLPGGDVYAVEALHAGALVDDHNSSNYGDIRTQTVTLTTNNVVDLDQWRYLLRVEVPYGAVSADAQLRIYSVRSVYGAANTLRHA